MQTVFGIIIVVITFRYCYEYYKDTSTKLEAANIRHHELLEDRNRFSREVEVLTKSKTDLEYALKLKSGELHKLHNECQSSKNKFENQINRDKSESMARFNALDSEHMMLKANKDDLEIEHKHLRKSFDRLKTDHGKIDSAYKKNIEVLKEKNEKIISSLQRQVEYYQKQENSLSIEVKNLKATIVQYQTALKDLMEKKAKEKVSQSIEHESENAEQSRSKHIEKTIDRGKFARSEETGGKVDSINKVAHVDDNSLESQKLLHHNIEKRNNEPKVKQKPNDLNNITNVLIEPDVRQDVVYMKRTKRHGNNGAQKEDVEEVHEDMVKKKRLKRHKNNGAEKQDVEEVYKRHKEWKNGENDKVDDTNFVGGQEGEKEVLVDDDYERLKMHMKDLNHANDKLNNDQKFDDHEVALQEGEENEDNAAEGEENDKFLETLLKGKK